MNETERAEKVRRRRGIQVRRTLMVFGLMILVTGGVVLFRWLDRQKKEPVPAFIPPTVSSLKLKKRSYPVHIYTRGEVRPFRDVVVTAQVSGKILRMEPEIGSPVTGFVMPPPGSAKALVQGIEAALAEPGVDLRAVMESVLVQMLEQDRFDEQALAIIDDLDYQLAAKEALTNLLAAAREYRRNKTLYETKGRTRIISEQEYEKSVRLLLLSEKALASARTGLRRTRVVNPFSGIVAERYVQAGDTVAPGTRIARVIDLSQVKVVVGLTSEEVESLRAARKEAKKDDKTITAVIHILGLDTYEKGKKVPRDFTGTVYAIAPSADVIGTYAVELLVKNPDRQILAGRPAYDVRIRIGQQTLLTIPRSAVREDRGGRSYVYLLNSINATRRYVSLDYSFAEDDSLVVVHDGLEEGETLIIPIEQHVADGKPVKLIEEPTETPPSENQTPPKAEDEAKPADAEEPTP